MRSYDGRTVDLLPPAVDRGEEVEAVGIEHGRRNRISREQQFLQQYLRGRRLSDAGTDEYGVVAS